MVPEPKKTLLKIRTFAQDLENARAQSGLPVTVGSKPQTPVRPEAVPSKPPAVTTVPKPIVQAAPSVSAPSANTPPLAFHELQKKIEPLILNQVPKSSVNDKKTTYEPPRKTVSVRARKQTPSRVNTVAGATVITDSRSSDYQLIPALIKGFTDWIDSIKRRSKERAIPKYTVTETDRRRGVIKKATSKTGSIFTADNDTLKEEIRRRKQAPITIPKNEPDITWSPNTEPGYALLPGNLQKSSISNVSVDFKNRTTPEIAAPVVTAPVQPIAEIYNFDETKVPPARIPEPVYVEPTPNAAPIVRDIPVEVPQVITEVTPQQTPQALETESNIQNYGGESYELTVPEARFKVRGLGDITKLNTNTLSLSIVALVAGLIIFIIILKALISFMIPDGVFTPIPEAVPISTLPTILDVTLTDVTTEALSTALNQVSADSPVEIRLVDQSGTPLSVDNTLSLTGLNVSRGLSGHIVDARIIVYRGERAVMFTVTDATASFGSLLSEESQLKSMVGETIKSSPESSCIYKDVALTGSDVRVCNKESGEELLVYGFTDTNTVLITRDLAIFTTILGSGQ